jgi:hypothetical protein
VFVAPFEILFFSHMNNPNFVFLWVVESCKKWWVCLLSSQWIALNKNVKMLWCPHSLGTEQFLSVLGRLFTLLSFWIQLGCLCPSIFKHWWESLHFGSVHYPSAVWLHSVSIQCLSLVNSSDSSLLSDCHNMLHPPWPQISVFLSSSIF